MTQLDACKVCEEKLQGLEVRRQEEIEAFQSAVKDLEYLYVIDSSWLRSWVDFIESKVIGTC